MLALTNLAVELLRASREREVSREFGLDWKLEGEGPGVSGCGR